MEDADAKRYSDVLRERLRDLNFKENGFILIANKLPAKYRGTAHLSFLQNIPWVTVFDLFDPSSKKDGLHHACNETSDAPRAKIRTLDEFKEITPDKDSLISTRSTTWIFNGEEMQKGDWIKCSKDCLYRALSAYKQCFPPGNLICVFLCLSENAVDEMADIMESSFSILGNSARNCVTILSESRNVAEPIIKASKPSLQKELGECSVIGIPWSLLKEIVRELVGPSKFEEKGATTELPYFTGFKEVLNKTISSWDDLELYCPNPRLPRLAEEIEKERGAFYKGAQVSQVNLFHGHSIPRSLEKDVSAKVGNALKFLTKENVYENYQVKTITVSYEPGSGATTLCRRILWSKKSEYRCAVVKAITSSTDYQIEKLQCIGYDEGNINFSRPVLVLVDNFPESDVRLLTEHVKRRQTRCVLLTTLPISTTASNFEITLRKLDEEETTRVKNILINITGIDSDRRREAEQVLEREKRFIWFGLELFGREYLKIKERLQNHIGNILGAFLGERLQEHQVLLEMCCFFNKYSDGNIILPHSLVLDFLYVRLSGNKTQCPAIQDIHEAFGGLLLEVQDEKHGYYGWRPAHSLVSEVVTSRIDVEETAILALEKVVQGKAYVMKFLKQQVFRLFLDRKRICDPVLLKEQAADDGTVGTDLENEVFGYYGRRTRYSPVIEEILERESSVREAGAMKVLLTVCEQATQTEEKAYAWQQLARFMGYEMRTNVMDENDNLHERLYKAMKKESTIKHPMPRNGIDAAHKAVDIAVSLQPSYTNHYNSKGVLYLLQLKDYKPPSLRSLPEAVEICRKALEVYDKALATSKGPNHFPMIGKIQAIMLLLEIIKELHCFHTDDMKFTRYLKEGDAPPEVVEMLSFEQQNFVQSLSSTILDVLNELFGSVKIKQTTTYDENEIRSLNNAKIRGSNLRRKFYEITGLDKTELSREEYSFLLSSPSQDLALYQQQVQDILYIKDETPYSAWSNLDNSHVNLIYQLLKSLCLRGHGSHNDMLICSKACLHLEEKPPVEDLDKIVKIFVEKFPNSEWANLFYYMIHFPIPNGGLAQYTLQTKEAIKKCASIVQEKAGSGFRKSGAEYFLGKGTGLNAIVNSHEFQWLERKWKTKTQFWRGKEPSEKLERVKGQKEAGRKGIISYRGLQINFDNTLYPNESKDDLWFYLGFTVAGPYAYDPVDSDTYASFQRQSASIPATFSAFSERSTYSSQLSNNTSNHGARRKVRSVPSHQPRAKDIVVEDNSDQNDSSDPDFIHVIPQASEVKTDWITVGGRFNALIERDSVVNPHKESEWHGNKQELSQDRWQTVERRKSKATESRAKAEGRNSRRVVGQQGARKEYFDLKREGRDGKLHHGAFVLGTRKSEECRLHKLGCDIELTDRCNFAHGWRGDTLQYVCTKCTEEDKTYCREKLKHKPYHWNLGPYLNNRGEIWKDEKTDELSRSWGSLEFEVPDFVVDWK